MAEEHPGHKQGNFLAAPWTKIFAAFRVAIDPQKLFLAALGIFLMALGWWLLAWIFYSPAWPTLDGPLHKVTEESFKDFKLRRMKWNLSHEMSGYLQYRDSKPIPVYVDVGDVAGSLEEYKELEKIDRAIKQLSKTVQITLGETDRFVKIDDGKTIYFMKPSDADIVRLKNLQDVKLSQLAIVKSVGMDKDQKPLPDKVLIAGIAIELADSKDLAEIDRQIKAGRSFEDIRTEAQREKNLNKNEKLLTAVEKYEALLLNPKIKPFGYLRTMPWYEERGPNPYLLVTGRAPMDQSEGVVNWLVTEQAPVLLEPLYKLFAPIKYWFDARGGFWNRVYLFLVIVWMLLVWGVIGGAITRMAIVQIARNEKIGPGEALRFVRARIQSYVTAPLLPMIFLAGIAIILLLFGLFEQIPLLGEITAGLFWPVVLILGLIMAIVLLGLIGWPLMYATLSAEGSDSFDAISRSYSYVLQATWSYLGYGILALLYGAVLIFFVGFLSSVMVYLGKWGISNGQLAETREPSYLFMYAPTSFGWRDLLLDKSVNAEATEVILQNGDEVWRNRLRESFTKNLVWYNYVGAALVGFWLTIFFMLVVGFGYSFFWTASSIIYLLMRQKVDDTEMDEIHMDDEEDAFTPPSYMPPDSKPAEPKPSTNVTMVDAPTLRPSSTASTAPPANASPPVNTSPPASTTTAVSSTPPATTSSPPPTAKPAAESPSPARAPKTMLAPPEVDPEQPPPEEDARKSSNGDEG